MSSASSDLRILETLLPSAEDLRVFDAETQETSYGIWILGGLPFIFDTHRSNGRFVATIELLTEVVQPVRVTRETIRRFARDARRTGLLPIPYSDCFFKGNLHVYSFSGPIRGFDLVALGRSAAKSEHTLRRRTETLWARIPKGFREAQRDLLNGRRRARYPADLEVLRRHLFSAKAARPAKPRRPRGTREPSRL